MLLLKFHYTRGLQKCTLPTCNLVVRSCAMPPSWKKTFQEKSEDSKLNPLTLMTSRGPFLTWKSFSTVTENTPQYKVWGKLLCFHHAKLNQRPLLLKTVWHEDITLCDAVILLFKSPESNQFAFVPNINPSTGSHESQTCRGKTERQPLITAPRVNQILALSLLMPRRRLTHERHPLVLILNTNIWQLTRASGISYWSLASLTSFHFCWCQ